MPCIRPISLYLSLLSVLLLAACAAQPVVITPQPATLRVVASDPVGPLLAELAAAYQQERPWVTVRLDVFSATVARQRLRAGAADLALVSWLDTEQNSLWSTPFARDAIAIVVHPDVPSQALDVVQLQEIFRGRVGEWADGTPIQVVSREEGSGLRSAFEAMVMGGYDVTLTALVVPSDEDVLGTVAATAGAIGYVSLARRGGDVRTLSIEGVLPTSATLAAYPLTYSLFLAAPAEPIGEVRAFAQWILGPHGQQWVRRWFETAP